MKKVRNFMKKITGRKGNKGKYGVQPKIIKEVTPSVNATEDDERKRLDSFYGCDEDGQPELEFMFMDFNSIGIRYLDCNKKYILKDIEALKEKISFRRCISAWRGTGKSEWEFMMGYIVVSTLRKAWKEHLSEVDITKLFQLELTALPTGYAEEKTVTIDGDTYRVFDQSDIKAKILPSFEILSETDDTVELRFKKVA